MSRSVLTLTVILAALSIVTASDFRDPVPLVSSGQPIDVEHEGHAAPFVGDFDGDGLVGFPDFLAMSENFGKIALASSGTLAAAVPEPTTALLVAFSGLAMLGFRRRG